MTPTRKHLSLSRHLPSILVDGMIQATRKAFTGVELVDHRS